MKLLYPLLLTLSISAVSTLAAADSNIIENGDFKSKRLKDWDVRITKSYYEKIKPEISKGEIRFEDLKGEYPRDFVFRQFVDLKPSTEYTVSFDVKGIMGAKNKIPFAVGRPHFACPKQDMSPYFHLPFQKLKITPEWKTYSYDFKTIYKTDNKDASKSGFDEKEAKKKWAKLGTDPGVAPTHVIFKIGDIEGEIHIRNVKLIEKK